jgi:hypothetical protein
MGLTITSDDFMNDGEVDCTAHYKGGAGKRASMSIRKANGTEGEYEVYVRYYGTGREEILKTGNLHECVEVTNNLLGMDDIVVSEY